jgi:hypothetical protein
MTSDTNTPLAYVSDTIRNAAGDELCQFQELPQSAGFMLEVDGNHKLPDIIQSMGGTYSFSTKAKRAIDGLGSAWDTSWLELQLPLQGIVYYTLWFSAAYSLKVVDNDATNIEWLVPGIVPLTVNELAIDRSSVPTDSHLFLDRSHLALFASSQLLREWRDSNCKGALFERTRLV